MMRLSMSAAASGLLRALLARTGVPRDRILLSDIRSLDWQSLAFVGERHELNLRITGPRAAELVAEFCDGLADAEFAIPGQIVADIAAAPAQDAMPDGSICFRIEALTVAE